MSWHVEQGMQNTPMQISLQQLPSIPYPSRMMLRFIAGVRQRQLKHQFELSYELRTEAFAHAPQQLQMQNPEPAEQLTKTGTTITIRI
ncbi:MAG: hypothetical protein MHM6MM_000042 [Cercozoa sp. M6MM]